MGLRSYLSLAVEICYRRFSSQLRQQNRSLAALNKDLGNEKRLEKGHNKIEVLNSNSFLILHNLFF